MILTIALAAALVIALAIGALFARRAIMSGREVVRLRARTALADGDVASAWATAQLAHQGIWSLTEQLVAANESALTQVSAELHDLVAQPLMLARYALERLPALVGPDIAAPPGFGPEDAFLYVREAERAVRDMMTRTHSPRLEEGATRALADLAHDMERRHGLTVTVDVDDVPELSDRDAITIYRFAQEALMNVVKHAKVDTAALSMRVDESGDIEATVTDAGVGFGVDEVSRNDSGFGVGLDLLRNRAEALGGRLDIMSRVGLGTSLTLRIPAAGVATSDRWTE